MKTVGIIAEYNPFHNGHAYQIEKVREITGADRVIVAMSGDFVQRGAPAVIDKYARTAMALGCGADLVLELPVIWAASSAENFAMAGVTLLEKTGCADIICFGAECDDLALLSDVADILLYEPAEFKATLDLHLRNGINFPSSRAAAIKKVLASRTGSELSPEYLDEVLGNPNNILAIEYLKALKRIDSSMTPCLIKREGAGYHNGGRSIKRAAGTPGSNDTQDIKASGDGAYASERISMSASGIRQALHDMTDGKGLLKPPVSFENAMPDHCVRILNEYAASYSLMDSDAFTSILNYLLLLYDRSDYYKFSDISPDLAARMESMRFETGSFDEICKRCKTRNMTYTRISRAFFHMILNIKDSDVKRGSELGYIPYLRVLGLKKADTADNVVSLNSVTSALRKNASVPIITKLADAANVLSGDALSMLETDIFASDLYAKTRLSNGQTCKNEYQKSPVIFSGENYLSTWN